MKKNISVYYLLVILSVLFQDAYGKVQIKKLSSRDEATIIPVQFKPAVKNLEDLLKKKTVFYRINYFTPEEAQEYFADYVRKKYPNNANELIKKYFIQEYFGLTPEKKIDPISQAASDDNLMGSIHTALDYFDKSKKVFKENDMKRWSAIVHSLSPAQVYQAFMLRPALRFTSRDLAQEGLDSFDKFRKKYPDKAKAIFSEKYFGGKPEITEPFGILSNDLLANIYQAAKKIMQSTKQGDYLIAFGNTPYFVGRALERLSSQNPSDKNYRNIISFPFSGAPNQTRPGSFPDFDDLVTKERLRNLSNRLKKVGLGPDNKDLQKASIYFIDVVGSGAGPAYAIEEILRLFTQAKVAIPDINIIALNPFNINDEEDPRHATIAKKNAQDGDTLTLYFPSIHKTHYTIDTYIVELKGRQNLDLHKGNPWRIYPQYGAARWLKEYDYLLEGIPTRNIQTKKLIEYFDANLENLIKKDKN